jgi:nuclear factor related to kappa-B-binding protein
MLVRDSQYVNPASTHALVAQVSSGALDRLHVERDPCVHFDNELRLWTYLHRLRTPAEFGRSHLPSSTLMPSCRENGQA